MSNTLKALTLLGHIFDVKHAFHHRLKLLHQTGVGHRLHADSKEFEEFAAFTSYEVCFTHRYPAVFSCVPVCVNLVASRSAC